MKKLLAFFLAMIMIASMPATVFAEANIGDHGEAATIIVSGISSPREANSRPFPWTLSGMR